MESGSLILTEGYSCGVTAFLEQKSSPPHVALELLRSPFLRSVEDQYIPVPHSSATSQCHIPVLHSSAASQPLEGLGERLVLLFLGTTELLQAGGEFEAFSRNKSQ